MNAAFFKRYCEGTQIDYTFKHMDIVERIDETSVTFKDIERDFTTLANFVAKVDRSIVKSADANVGINWEVIDYNIEYVFENSKNIQEK